MFKTMKLTSQIEIDVIEDKGSNPIIYLYFSFSIFQSCRFFRYLTCKHSELE